MIASRITAFLRAWGRRSPRYHPAWPAPADPLCDRDSRAHSTRQAGTGFAPSSGSLGPDRRSTRPDRRRFAIRLAASIVLAAGMSTVMARLGEIRRVIGGWRQNEERAAATLAINVTTTPFDEREHLLAALL